MTFANVSTVVGAGGCVAIVAEVYNTGISYGIALPISFIFGMIILGIVSKRIKQVGDKYKAHTIVDFFEKRYDKRNQILTGILQLFTLIVWISVQAVAMASLGSVLLGLEYNIALILAAVITILYTAMGGLKIDIITDFIQFWIIFIIFILMAIIGYIKVGGFSSLLSSLPNGHLNLFAFGGVSWFMGAVLLSGFLYLGNTAHWQRIFSAENEDTARKAFYLSIPFVIILGLTILFLGLVSASLLTGINKDIAIFSLIGRLLPKSLTGIGFAAILAVIMSSIDSLLVGGSTIIYKAIYKEKRKKITTARIITGFFGIIGFLIAYLIPDIVLLSIFVVYLALLFVPPIFAGLYSKKISADASFYSILIPFMFLLILFPISDKSAFLITTPLGIIIISFYDKLSRKKIQPKLL